MTEPTPGPWRAYSRIVEEYPWGIETVADEPLHLALVKWRDSAGQANARLIAQAPFLLGLAEMVALLGPGDPGVENLKRTAERIIAEVKAE